MLNYGLFQSLLEKQTKNNGLLSLEKALRKIIRHKYVYG
jgi:hypothetical protein